VDSFLYSRSCGGFQHSSSIPGLLFFLDFNLATDNDRISWGMLERTLGTMKARYFARLRARTRRLVPIDVEEVVVREDKICGWIRGVKGRVERQGGFRMKRGMWLIKI
jgi:hypothetical protein